MMSRALPLLPIVLVLLGCQTNPDKQTISQLRDVPPDLSEVYIDDSLLKALSSYRQFLNETPQHTMAPEAMRRLADLQIEKEYGVIGDGVSQVDDSRLVELPAPQSSFDNETHPVTITESVNTAAGLSNGQSRDGQTANLESEADFEQRTTARFQALVREPLEAAELPEYSADMDTSGPAQAIETYKKILSDYPWYERNDQVLYQMARAYDELAQPDEAMQVVERLIAEYPESKYVDEVYFRRGEFYFVRKKYLDAEDAYLAVVAMGEGSVFYELALYKLGWSLYKQELYEEALHQYIALLDFKLSNGYDFDAAYTPEGVNEEENTGGEGEERRVTDTFRVVSLSFSNLGGPEVLSEYFGGYGNRVYEDRIYRNLAEFHLEKRRFNDAAEVYKSFVELNPIHTVSPRFSMRVSEIYTEGDFPLLVVESKRDFATRYGIKADYWQYFDLNTMPDVVDYLKTNLTDLANHYHALYQQVDLEDEQPENYAEALHWYDEFLDSFPEDEISPAINYQLADLLLEHGEFAASAREYERTAYDYPAHERASAAGYAAIFSHRENLDVVSGAEVPGARLATVDSSLKFAETFPTHEQAATVLGAATEDLYDMQDFERAIVSGRWLIESYPDAETALRQTAWMIVAHSSFDTALYPDAELGYSEVLGLMAAEDEERQAVVDNLAASIYKQGEQARLQEDYVAAADHFLRIKTAAPTSEIRPAAEYDAAAALIHLEDWLASAEVLEDFRAVYPDHELRDEATQQLAVVYEKAGDLARSASEYERVADDTADPEMRREAILVAGDLYEQADEEDEVLRVYQQYLEEFSEPLERGLEIRFKVAGIHQERGATDLYLEQLQAIVALDGAAAEARTDRTRYLGANASLVLTRPLYESFKVLTLTQPFEESLAMKKDLMDQALAGFDKLVAYEVGEVTAAATFYMAQIYGDFSTALLESERPSGLSGADLDAYELVIEEEAYPFEEQSIAVHQENLELIRIGIYNDWVQRSMKELAVLMPGRYAKHEISNGYVGSIDEYAYLSPRVPELEQQGSPDAELSGLEPPAEPTVETSAFSEEITISGVEDVAMSH